MSPKHIKKLADKKYRNETGLFLVEGEKNIQELLASDFAVEEIHGTNDFLDSISSLIRSYEKRMGNGIKLLAAKEDELAKMGTLMTNDAGIAVAVQQKTIDATALKKAATKNFVLALDDVRDPGNLGTIMRIADWFGVTHIVASETTTDVYNPKTIAASMGSFTRVSITYLDLVSFLNELRGTPILGADLEGKNIHAGKLPSHGVLVMGSESHGISDDVASLLTEKLTIPKFGGAESLNVSVATGILLDALRRQ